MAVLLGTAAALCAQSRPAPGNDTATTLPRSALEDLPSSGTLAAPLETTIPEIISDRIDGGGLSVGSESRLGARGSSWTQTAFQFGESDVTDAGRFGTSPLFLDPQMVEAVEMTTAMMPIERSAPGVSVHLTPRRPQETWRGRAEFLAMPAPATPPNGPTPAIATLRTWNRIAASASGPIRHDRLGVIVGVSATNATRYERADPTQLRSQELGGFAHVLFTPSTHDELSGIIVGRSARIPLDGRLWIAQPDARRRTSDLLMESEWHHRARHVSLIAAGAFGRGTVDPSGPQVQVAYVDSIRDMPVMDAVSAERSRHHWSGALRAAGLADAANRWIRGGHAGVEIGGATDAEAAPLASSVAETVEGFPARLWQISTGLTEPRHHETAAAAYIAETVPVLSRLMIDGGFRWERVTAGADGGGAIQWTDWFPRVSVRWDMVPREHLSAVMGLGRYGHRLPLEALAYGDPASRSAQVFRWTDRNGDGRFENGEEGPLVARVGDTPAGTSTIDSHLKRPYLDELLLGVELRPSADWTVRFAGLTRQERRLMGAIDTGVPLSGYTVTTVPDAGADVLDPSDDQQLPVYNRRPEAFGEDQYVLTNPRGLSTTFDGLALSVRHGGERLQMMAGATAGRVSGPAAARGFQVFQNDGAIPTDAFSNPNAATFVHGSFFSDRSYTIKASGTYRLPHDVRLGLVARYQDGQPFSRLVVVQDLNQGTEAIRAYRNGRTRFTYTMTVDTRLQAGFHVAGQRLALVWDLFNLLNMSNEVEESVVTGPAFRTPTALQPPRTMHLGVRIGF